MNRSAALLLAALTASAAAQECALPADRGPSAWAPPGTRYQNPENPFIEEFSVFARLHLQQAWIDGDAGGRGFWYSNHGELRRFWPGARARLAGGAITLHHEMMLEDDLHPVGGDRDLSYRANWASYIEWQLDKTFPAVPGGSWWLGYGKRCLPLAEEVLDSSKLMPVVERSAISNRALITTTEGSAPMGAWLRHRTGRWESYAGLYTTDSAAYYGNWDDGTAIILQTQRDIADLTGTDSALAALAFYHNDTGTGDDTLSGAWNWAASAWTVLGEGPWTFRGNLLFGEADSTVPDQDGPVWGGVGTVERRLFSDRVELVARYHYQASREARGISPYSRYALAAVAEELRPAPSVRGDEQHGFYLGLNWLARAHQLKFMTGIEWDHVSSNSREVYQGTTLWLATRCYF